jgi:hypothetical protein
MLEKRKEILLLLVKIWGGIRKTSYNNVTIILKAMPPRHGCIILSLLT